MKHDTAALTETIFALAHAGADRPRQLEGDVGRFLSLMTCQTSSYYKPVFDEEIRKLRPDWFKKSRNRAPEMKQHILKVAQSGASKATLSKDAKTAMYHYMTRSCRSYDAEFERAVYEANPEWSRENRVEKEKQKLLSMARDEGVSEMPSFAYRYLRPSQPSYDEALLEQVRQLRPIWFERRIIESKMRLLAYAEEAGSRPSHAVSGMTLYNAFRRYTRPADSHYDPELTETLKTRRPDWFKRRWTHKPKSVADDSEIIEEEGTEEAVAETEEGWQAEEDLNP